MKLWIDIATPPHATLFRPVVDELRNLGHETIVTVWDRGQTRELALAFWPDAAVVGTGYRRPLLDKAAAIWARGRELAKLVAPQHPDVAVSHNSYSQIVSGRLLRIPTVTVMDYEYQPANHLAFRLAHRIILPEAIPMAAVRRFGCSAHRVLRYKGLKEEITLATFRPSPLFKMSIGLADDRPLVTVRPPAEGALYHRRPNAMLPTLLHRLGTLDAHILVSARTAGQAAQFAAIPGVTILSRTVSGADLLFHSDIVIGAGGTMTREAAVLGTKTYTIFQGRRPAVDQQLIDQRRLHTLDNVADFDTRTVVACGPRSWEPNEKAVTGFVRVLLDAVPNVPR